MKLLFLATAANALRAPTSMSVAVFGSTGLTGRECTHQLLERGVPVRALCRDPAKLLTPLGSTGKEDLVENEQLYKYKGSAQNQPVRRVPGIALSGRRRFDGVVRRREFDSCTGTRAASRMLRTSRKCSREVMSRV